MTDNLPVLFLFKISTSSLMRRQALVVATDSWSILAVQFME